MKASFHKYVPAIHGLRYSSAPEEFVFEFRVSAEELRDIGPHVEAKIRQIVEEDNDEENRHDVLSFLAMFFRDEDLQPYKVALVRQPFDGNL